MRIPCRRPLLTPDRSPLVTDLGYITVGESIDPEDWARPGTDTIVRRVKEERETGRVILLHDAGGDRSQTVAALPRILEFLKARGDLVVPAGKLLGLKREDTMPRLTAGSPTISGVITNAGLLSVHWGEELFWAFMIVASGLTLVRSVVIAILALRRKPRSSVGNFTPSVSVLIAAYNEEKVISETLRSVLNTDYAGSLEVIVVDDGSKDATAAKAEEVCDSRVRVLRQANSGKSGALTRGLATAANEIIVFLDADTQFQTDTLRLLVQPLADPRVGAVSGHARVGNLQTWIARFQSLEYICGFNLDRRAYDRVNAITVVPGAISAIRRKAIEEVGGFDSATLAEDTDLTLSLHRKGWRVTYAPEAIAWTEAPDSIRALAKQDFVGLSEQCNVSVSTGISCSTLALVLSAASAFPVSRSSKSCLWLQFRLSIYSSLFRCFRARDRHSSSTSWHSCFAMSLASRLARSRESLLDEPPGSSQCALSTGRS